MEEYYVDYRYSHVQAYRHSVIIVIHHYNQFTHIYFECNNNNNIENIEKHIINMNGNNKYLINEKWKEIEPLLIGKNIPEVVLKSLKKSINII